MMDVALPVEEVVSREIIRKLRLVRWGVRRRMCAPRPGPEGAARRTAAAATL
jgi:hypothetical protein